MKYLIYVFSLIILFASNSVYAASSLDPSTVDRKHVTEALERLSKATDHKLTLDSINLTPISGLLEVISEANILYISSDGKYLVSGDLIDLSKDKEDWNLTDLTARKIRAKLLAAFPAKDMIIYPSSKKQIGSVTVFTDFDCGYCRKMQDDIDEYSDAGIEIRYMAFPRSGPGSPSYEKAVTVWCAKDRETAFTLAMAGKELPKNNCKDNPVYKEFDLGRKLGVSGTPTMFLANGVKIPGYIKAHELVKIIKKQGK